jgi:hypothetical protein
MSLRIALLSSYATRRAQAVQRLIARGSLLVR